MAWIEVHQALTNNHRKVVVAADILGAQEAHIIGHLVCLWTWALDNAPDGILPATNRLIARACQWEGDADALVSALANAGFLDITDSDILIHDWDDYAGRLIEKRKSNAVRMRSARAKHESITCNARATHVQNTCNARAGATVPYQTVPNQTEQDQEVDITKPILDSTPTETPDTSHLEDFLPSLLKSDRFPQTRTLAEYSQREFGKPLFHSTTLHVGVVERFEEKLNELGELALSVTGRVAMAPIDDRCLQDYWKNKLLQKNVSNTSNVFAGLINQAITDLAQRKQQRAKDEPSPAKQVTYEVPIETFREMTPEQQAICRQRGMAPQEVTR